MGKFMSGLAAFAEVMAETAVAVNKVAEETKRINNEKEVALYFAKKYTSNQVVLDMVSNCNMYTRNEMYAFLTRNGVAQAHTLTNDLAQFNLFRKEK